MIRYTNIYKNGGNKAYVAKNTKSKGNASPGYVSSKAIRKRISDWEGASMYKPAPDTGKVNRPFEAEDKDFWNVIPTHIRPYLSQDMLDALYSTSYNIGIGNFKNRVVPELENFFIKGTGSIDAIKKSMYGTRDKEPKMSGLRRRREAERKMFEDAYNSYYPNGYVSAAQKALQKTQVPNRNLINITQPNDNTRIIPRPSLDIRPLAQLEYNPILYNDDIITPIIPETATYIDYAYNRPTYNTLNNIPIRQKAFNTETPEVILPNFDFYNLNLGDYLNNG